jgi:glycosyltransferase involved in cell wall biosynthesis
LNKVSVVIPCYNCEKYITECLDSIVNQTYKNIEIILVDDGSNDDTLSIVEKYKNIIVIKNTNKGVSNARNCGIYKSTGDYIIFIDSDDYIEKNAIKTMMDCMIKDNLDMVRSNYKKIIGKKLYSLDSLYKSKTFINKNNFKETIYRFVLGTEKFNYACSTIYRLDIIKENKILFDENIINGEDAIFVMDYIKHINSICYIPDELYIYRIHENSMTKKGKSIDLIWDNKLKYINELRKKEKEWNMEQYGLVDCKIIYILLSCIYRVVKFEDDFEYIFKMIEDINLNSILKKINYTDLDLTEDRKNFLKRIKENDINGAIKVIERW